MTTLARRITETLAEVDSAHKHNFGDICPCGEVIFKDYEQTYGDQAREHYRIALAAALAPVITEAQADLIDALADLLDEYQASHDVAECAAYVEGETGRQACIDNWEAITEEPAEWLRKKAVEHRGHDRDHLQELLFEAWQAGCEEAMDAAGYAPGPRNAMYDRNPYKEES